MLKCFLIVALSMVVVSAKKKHCTCNDDFDYTHPISDDATVQNLEITHLGLPGEYNERFVDNIQTFVGSFSIAVQRMKEKKIKQVYIKRMQKYQTGFVQRINAFGSFSANAQFATVITSYSTYLTSQIEDVQQYIQTIKETDVQYYFYNMMLEMISSRSFYTFALKTSQCIYKNETTVHNDQGGKSNESKDSSELKDKSGESKDKSGEVKDKSGESKDKSGEVKDKSGESKDKSGEVKDKSGESKDKSGEVKDKSGESTTKTPEQ